MTKKSNRKEWLRIAEYMISGGAYFWSGYFVFFIIDKIIRGSFFWAKSISTLVGWSVNYVLQRYWAFNNPNLKKHQTQVNIRYTIITVTDFIIDYLIVWGLKHITILGITINPYIGQFVSSGFFSVWNYLWYKYWVFPEMKKTKRAKPTLIKTIAHRAASPAKYIRNS